jgi:Uncharacterized protein conserved in bacteria
VEALRRRLRVKYPFFGSITAAAELIADPEIATSATDGRRIYYNPDYMAALSEEERLFVLAHEVCHIAFDHVFRSAGKDPSLWDLATDAVVNAFLEEDGLSPVPGAIDLPEALQYDAEELYSMLQSSRHGNPDRRRPSDESEKEQDSSRRVQKSPGGSRSKGSREGTGNRSREAGGEQGGLSEKKKRSTGHDSHELWEAAAKQRREQSELSDGADEAEGDREAVRNCVQLGEKEAFRENELERTADGRTARSLAGASGGYGNGEAVTERSRVSVGRARPVFEWRRILKEAIKHQVEWSYENAEIEEGVVCARLEETPWPETEVVLDTSGSIDEVLLRNFLRECKNILMLSKLQVGCFDVKFTAFTRSGRNRIWTNCSSPAGEGQITMLQSVPSPAAWKTRSFLRTAGAGCLRNPVTHCGSSTAT